MKKVICLLIGISILLLFNSNSKGQTPDEPKLYSHEIEDAYWYGKGGKIELIGGCWRFGAKEKSLKIKTEEIVDVDYVCFCRFIITNNSEASYKINPSIMLLDYYRATLFRIPPQEYYGEGQEYEEFRRSYDKRRVFKPKVLKPGEGWAFEDKFDVSREIVLKTSTLKLELSIAEVNEDIY